MDSWACDADDTDSINANAWDTDKDYVDSNADSGSDKRLMKDAHGFKEFLCHLCNNRFTRKDHLNRHIESVHVKYVKHECSACNQEFSRKDSLTRHVNEIHARAKK